MNLNLYLDDFYRRHGAEIPVWRRPPPDSNFFNRSPSGRTIVQLSPIATKGFMWQYRPADSGRPGYILFKPEGDLYGYPQEDHELRDDAQFLMAEWEPTMLMALTEQCYIYNTRSKKSCRPVWYKPYNKRSIFNMTLEPVRVLPHNITFDAEFRRMKLPPNVRIFDIESGREVLDRTIKRLMETREPV